MGDIEQNDIEQRSLSLGSEVHQELVRRISKEKLWAEYFLLINACLEVLGEVPDVEQMDVMPVHLRLNLALDRLAKVVTAILPGGLEEFADNYMPRPPTPSLPLSTRALELKALAADIKIQADHEPLR